MPKKIVLTLPPKVELGYRTLPLNWASESLARNAWGEFANWTGELTVRKGLSPVDTANTLIHEINHAILRLYGHPIVATEEEEGVVEVISNGLIEWWRRNPDSIAFMHHCLKAPRQ